MKVRFTLTAIDDPGHYFLRDKWILRKVAERYLPQALAYRKKRGFPVSAQDRLRITAAIKHIRRLRRDPVAAADMR
jgi:asparagine synthetase B (glutamine-hydrolysing)